MFRNIKLISPAVARSFEEAKAEYARTGRRPALKFQVTDPTGLTVVSGIASVVEANWPVQGITKALGRRQEISRQVPASG